MSNVHATEAHSGWTESLPPGWSECHMRWLAKLYSGGTPDKSKEEYWTDGSIPWLNSGSVNQGYITEASAFISDEGLNNSSARWVPQGALVMALAGQGKTKGMVAQMGMRATCNQSMAAIVPYGVNARFLFYWLSANYRRIRSGASDDLRDGLNLQMLGDIPCPVPGSHLDQERIANFLDDKTARIDALIAEKERLVERLVELRYATVSWAVAGGLHQSRGTVKTGNIFVPELPSGWSFGGLTKYIGPIVDYRGKTPEKVEEGVLLVTARNIRDGELNYEASTEYVRPEDYAEIMRRGQPELGDVLFTTEAPLGEVANVDQEGFALAQRVVKFRGLPSILNNYYLKYWLMSDAVQSTLSTLATGSTAEGIKASKLGQIPLAVPPPAEQAQIVEFLDERRVAIDRAKVHVIEHIARLREYRSSLISAAVTGQLDIGSFKESA
jgi:type I restriction enzyme S subunit